MNFNELISQFSRFVHRYNDFDVTQMCGLAEGTNANTIKNTNQIVYNLYNQQLTKVATDNIVMTACTLQDVSISCYYLVSIDVNGTVTITKGVDNAYALPATPAGTVAIGAFLVVTDASTQFTSGTDDLSTSGLTVTFYDIDTGIAAFLINQAQKRLERGVTIIRNGRKFTIADFDYMIVRAHETIVQGDTTVTLPFGNYKNFQDNGLTITDSSGTIYPMFKRDIVPVGTSFQARPGFISRVPSVETVFTPDSSPAKEFQIWPESDAAYTIDTIAYQYSYDLDGVLYSTNWLTENAPDVLLFGALVEWGSYAPGDARIPEWKDRWQEAVWTLYTAQSKEKYSGTPISTKFPGMETDNQVGIATNKDGILSYGFWNN